MTDIKAVIFDWGGTLTPWHDVDLRESWAAFARGYGTMACALNNLTAQLTAAEAEAWRRSHEEHRSARIEEILHAAGVHPEAPATQAGLEAYWAFWEPHSVTHRWVDPVWYGLRERGIKIGVLSNTAWPRSYHRSIFERDELAHLIDADVYTCEIEVTKPHPDAFHATLAALNVTADEAVYVGDRLHEDIWGAAQVGLRTVFLEHAMFAGDRVAPAQITPDATIDHLESLLDVVDAWRDLTDR